ncbi:MAG: hypothetical protein AAB152_18675 [Candidatus Coatesbacteria bacterium]
MRRATGLAAAVLVASALGGRAGAATTTPAGAAFLAMPLSVQQMGMGDVTLGGHDIMRAWMNPAMLAEQANEGEVAINGGPQFQSVETTLGLGVGWKRTPQNMIGAFLSYYSAAFPEVSLLGDETGTKVAVNNIAAGVAAAYRWEVVRIGVTAKFLSQSYLGESSAGVAGDAGALVTWKGITGGVSARNLGPNPLAPDEMTSFGMALPFEIRGGLSYSYVPMNLSVGAEYVAAKERNPGIGAGVEWWLAKYLGARAGYMGLNSGGSPALTFGLSAMYAGIGLDYAMQASAVGSGHHISLSYAVGAKRSDSRPAAAGEALPEAAEDTGTKLNVAVADLKPEGVSSSDAAVISELLRAELVMVGTLNVVEKANMDKILAEHAFQQSGCTAQDCAVKLGKILNVRRMIVGSFGKFMNRFYITVRVVDVTTGKVLFSDTERMGVNAEVQDAVHALAGRVAKRMK